MNLLLPLLPIVLELVRQLETFNACRCIEVTLLAACTTPSLVAPAERRPQQTVNKRSKLLQQARRRTPGCCS